jgi:hypothetical protein
MKQAVGALAGALALALAPTAEATQPVTTIEVPGTIVLGIPSSNNPDALPYSASIWPVTGLLSPPMGQSVSEGAVLLDQRIQEQGGDAVIVTSMSQGGLVAHTVQNSYALSPSAPPPDRLAFIYTGDPQRPGNGLFTVLPWFALEGYLPTPPLLSQYDTTYIVQEYDGITDSPDRPWNLLADLNAYAGFAFGRHEYYDLDAPHITTSYVNSRGATVTTEFYPAAQLPLTQPLRLLGVDTAPLDAVLRPVVDRGYSRNDPQQLPPPTSAPSKPTVTSLPSPTAPTVQLTNPAVVSSPVTPLTKKGGRDGGNDQNQGTRLSSRAAHRVGSGDHPPNRGQQKKAERAVHKPEPANSDEDGNPIKDKRAAQPVSG